MFVQDNGGMDNLSGSTPEPLLLQAVHAVDMELTKVRDLDPTFLSAPDKAELLRCLTHTIHQAHGLLVDTMGVATDVADHDACATPGAWLKTHTQLDAPTAAGLQKLATSSGQWRRVREAMRDGTLSPRRAQAITDCLDNLGTEASAAVRAQAEEHLIELARDHDASELRRLGEHLLEVIDPEIFQAHEQARLEEQERAAREATRLSIRRRGDGTSRLSGVLPDAAAQRLKIYLNAFTNPRHTTTDGGTQDAEGGAASEPSAYVDPVSGRRLTGVRLCGEAFCAFLEAADPRRIPSQGGASTTIVVTIDLDKLRAGLGWALTGDSDKLTAAEVRRLACQANLVPAVLGGDSEVLDLGRSRRLFSPAQRLALGLRWKTCAIDGCEIPGEWCEVHHLDPWASGGTTDLANGIKICPRHHHYVDDPRFTLTQTPAGYQLRRRN
jgi:hypothetical protein